MKFTLNCGDLYALVTKAEAATSKSAKSGLAPQFMTSILLETEKKTGKLTVSASDGSKSIIVRRILDKKNGESVDESGSVILESSFIRNILAVIPAKDSISLDSKGDRNEVIISWSNGYAKMMTLSDDSFNLYVPSPAGENSTVKELDIKWILDSISGTAFSVGKDELHPVMSGIDVSFDEIGARITTTNQKTLSVRTSPDGKNAEKGEALDVVVPSNITAAIKTFLSGREGKVKMTSNPDGSVKLECGPDEMAFRSFTAAKYPSWRLLLSKFGEATGTMKAVKKEILGTLSRLRTSAGDKNLVILSITPGVLGAEAEWTSSNPAFSSMTRETGTVEYEGSELKIAFDGETLESAIKAMPTEEFKILFHSFDKAAFLIWEDETQLAMIMPLRLPEKAV